MKEVQNFVLLDHKSKDIIFVGKILSFGMIIQDTKIKMSVKNDDKICDRSSGNTALQNLPSASHLTYEDINILKHYKN